MVLRHFIGFLHVKSGKRSCLATPTAMVKMLGPAGVMGHTRRSDFVVGLYSDCLPLLERFASRLRQKATCLVTFVLMIYAFQTPHCLW